MPEYCTVTYRPDKTVPKHLASVLRVKGLVLPAKKKLEVSAAQAGMLLACAPKGSLHILDGEPTPYVPKTRSAKAAARRVLDAEAVFGRDPAAALEAIPQLTAKTRAALAGGDPERYLHTVEVDELAAIAIYCRLSARDDLANFCARRMQRVLIDRGELPARMALQPSGKAEE